MDLADNQGTPQLCGCPHLMPGLIYACYDILIMPTINMGWRVSALPVYSSMRNDTKWELVTSLYSVNVSVPYQ